MNSETQSEQSVPVPEAPNYSVPWKFIDNWIAVALLALIQAIVLFISLTGSKTALVQSVAVVLLEATYVLPVVLILAWRHVPWKVLGFGKFDLDNMALGCGLLLASYVVIIVHNYLLERLGVATQGDQISKLFAGLVSPIWILIAGAVVAPFVEEMFFRGFLFQGFRQKYGWVNGLLLSSAIFAAAHLDLAALIPTFILGCLLAYLYQRTNSLWPGIILHFLVNAFGLVGAYFLTHGFLIPW